MKPTGGIGFWSKSLLVMPCRRPAAFQVNYVQFIEQRFANNRGNVRIGWQTSADVGPRPPLPNTFKSVIIHGKFEWSCPVTLPMASM